MVAPAKLNLGLRVVGRRPDGFHELDSLFAHLDLADELEVVPARDVQDDALERLPAGDEALDARPLDLGPDNLVRRAIAALRSASAGALPPVRARLLKRVPWGAGLGGGSADAAAALRAAAALLQPDARGATDLAPLAEALGSDVPFCLSGVAVARVGGRGERLAPLELPARWVVLVHPWVPVAAADAYRWWAADPVAVAPMDAVVAAWRDGAPLPLANALEPAVAARVPEVAAVLAALRALDVGPVAMSGSGSTCFAVVDGAREAAAAAAELRARRPTWWVRAARAGVARPGS